MGLRLLVVAVACMLFWVPWLYYHVTTESVDLGSVSEADAAIVFGAIVRNGGISPLHEERLLSAKQLYDNNKIKIVVVSNSSRAAGIMSDYLVGQGVPEEAIEIDGRAEKTSETCVNEKAKGLERSVVLISQSFHLPRIAYHCAKAGITGQFFAAEKFHSGPRVDVPIWTKVRVRGLRYLREAALTWSVLIGAYEHL